MDLPRHLVTEVTLEDIPPPIRFMGYKPEHFVRTGFVSRFPPGSLKAPIGSPIGDIPHWDALGDTDPSVAADHQPRRPIIGWNLTEILLGRARDWGKGWGHDEGDREGRQWWDQDTYANGANGEFAPAWHVLGPPAHIDTARFEFDLDHHDTALYSFVDNQRRVVMANTLALAVPCGMVVNSSCGASCDLHGTGLNRLQCITRTLKTRCGQPVVDECNNDCGLKGQQKCAESAVALGSVRIGSSGQSASSSFALSVGRPHKGGLNVADNALYMTHHDVTRSGLSQHILKEFSYPLPIVDSTDKTTDTFNRNKLNKRLKLINEVT